MKVLSRMQKHASLKRLKQATLFLFFVATFVSNFQLPRTGVSSLQSVPLTQYLVPQDCPTPPCFDFCPECYLREHEAHMAMYRSESNRTRSSLVREAVRTRRLLSPRLIVFQHRYIYCHVHKNGGTALNLATLDHPDRIVLYNRQEKKMGPELFDEEVARVQSFPNALYFSFIRDPVSRYLSAVRQTSSSKNQRKVSLDKDFAGCTEDNFAESALDLMEHSFLNTHFMPQVLELRHCLPAGNTNITLTGMANLNDYVGRVLNIDMGSSSPNLTKKELPSADLIARICRRYKMDVDLIRSMGSIDSPCLA